MRQAVEAAAAAAEAPPPGAVPDRARWGAAQVVAAALLVARDRRLRRAALLPTLLTLVACALLAGLGAHRREEEAGARGLFTAFVALSSMPPTLLHRLWTRVGLAAREALGAPPGELERPGEAWLALVLRESVKAVRQAAVVAAGLAPVFGVVEALPFVGHGVTVVAGLAWAFYWIVVDGLEIPMELLPGRLGEGPVPWFERVLVAAAARSRWLFLLGWTGRLCGWLARPWRQECAFTERHRAASLGFGAAAALFLAIPVVNVFFRAVVITGATALLVRCGVREAADVEPPPPPG